jgi:hypothetical protein
MWGRYHTKPIEFLVFSARAHGVGSAPSAGGGALITARPASLVIRLVVTYTPQGGEARKVTVSGVRII